MINNPVVVAVFLCLLFAWATISYSLRFFTVEDFSESSRWQIWAKTSTLVILFFMTVLLGLVAMSYILTGHGLQNIDIGFAKIGFGFD